jgi:predicted Holliday junction resolvase-like endonuclease
MEVVIMKLISPIVMLALLAMIAACGDKKDSAARDQEVQKVLQEGMQKEKAMTEGMQKGVENIEKKLTDQKDASKK